jgi:hypothetical protein
VKICPIVNTQRLVTLVVEEIAHQRVSNIQYSPYTQVEFNP